MCLHGDQVCGSAAGQLGDSRRGGQPEGGCLPSGSAAASAAPGNGTSPNQPRPSQARLLCSRTARCLHTHVLGWGLYHTDTAAFECSAHVVGRFLMRHLAGLLLVGFRSFLHFRKSSSTVSQ